MERTELSKSYDADIDYVLIVSPDNSRCSRLGIQLTRENWPLGFRLVTMVVEYTPDNGRSWRHVGTTTFHGGTITPVSSVLYGFSAHDGQPFSRRGDLRIRFRATQAFVTGIHLITTDDPSGPLAPIHHSVAVDGETNTSATVLNGSSQSVSRTSAGSDRCGVGHYGVTADVAITAVTWNAVAADDSLNHVVGTASRAGVYVFKSPPLGSSTVLFDWGADSASGAVGASGYNGVNQSSPVRAGSKTTDGVALGEAMVCACTSVNGDMGVAGGSVFGGTLSSPLGTDFFNASPDTETFGAGQFRSATGATVSLGWTADDDCAMAALTLEAAGAVPKLMTGSGFQRSHRPAPFKPGFGR